MKNRKRNNLGQFVKHSSKSEISFVNLSTYTSPEVTEVPNQEWIGYGEDNNYFQFLIDRYNGSPTDNACINGISQQIYGKGLGATDSNRKPEQYAEMITLFKKDIVRKLCYDLKLMGQCAMQVIYSKDRSKIAQIEHMPIETLRAEKRSEEHTSELQSPCNLVCRLLLEKKKIINKTKTMKMTQDDNDIHVRKQCN